MQERVKETEPLQSQPPSSEDHYLVSFGMGQVYHKHYLEIFGTYEEARATAFAAHGKEWSMIYQWEEEGAKSLRQQWGYTRLATIIVNLDGTHTVLAGDL